MFSPNPKVNAAIDCYFVQITRPFATAWTTSFWMLMTGMHFNNIIGTKITVRLFDIWLIVPKVYSSCCYWTLIRSPFIAKLYSWWLKINLAMGRGCHLSIIQIALIFVQWLDKQCNGPKMYPWEEEWPYVDIRSHYGPTYIHFFIIPQRVCIYKLAVLLIGKFIFILLWVKWTRYSAHTSREAYQQDITEITTLFVWFWNRWLIEVNIIDPLSTNNIITYRKI